MVCHDFFDSLISWATYTNYLHPSEERFPQLKVPETTYSSICKKPTVAWALDIEMQSPYRKNGKNAQLCRDPTKGSTGWNGNASCFSPRAGYTVRASI